ncbi:MAG: hypothetical protein SFW64_02365 [Alphaproteobacteria bacterium]|nr:hypothetical protein [Alphaproteobacteria bacterium]
MKTKYVVLLLFVGAMFLMRVDWDKVQNPEYRQITQYSEEQRVLFEKRLVSGMQTQTHIYLRDLVDFEWDTVCVMGGYSHLREDINQKIAYGRDFPLLAHFPNVEESKSALVFIKNETIVAVIHHGDPRIRYIFNVCADTSRAIFKTIALGANVSFEKLKANNYVIRPIDLKKYEGCKGTQCDLTF